MRHWLLGTIGAVTLGLLSLTGAKAAPVSEPAHASATTSSVQDARWRVGVTGGIVTTAARSGFAAGFGSGRAASSG